jgi:hypothetical protein
VFLKPFNIFCVDSIIDINIDMVIILFVFAPK